VQRIKDHEQVTARALPFLHPLDELLLPLLYVFGAFLEAGLCGGEMINSGPVGIPSSDSRPRRITWDPLKTEKSVCLIFGDSGGGCLSDEVISNAP
jgi:hypothetical protein